MQTVASRLRPAFAAGDAGRGRAPRVAAQAGVALGASAAAILLGYAIARDPAALHLGASADPAGVAALLCGLAACALAMRYPAAGLCLLVGFIYLDLSEVLVRHHGLPSVLQLLVVPLLVAAWFEQRRADAVRPALPPALTLALVAYTLLLLASTTWARDRSLADARTLEVAKAVVLYAAVVVLASTRDRLRRAIAALLAAGAFLAGLGLFQALTGTYANSYGGLARVKHAQIYGTVFEPRIAGPLGDPNFFAQALLMLVPVVLAFGWSTGRRWARVAAFGAAALLVGATVLTYSRGGALALAAVLGLALLARGIKLRRLVAGLALALVLLPFLPDGFTRRLTTLEQILPGGDAVLKPDASFGKRRVLTAVAWQMFVDRPVQGVGAGNYPARFAEYVENVGSAAREYEADVASYPHSLYLEVAAETGLLGLAAFGFVLVACFTCVRRARRAFLAAGHALEADLARGFGIGLIGYLISSLFLHGHHIRYLFLLFAFAAALYRISLTARRAGEEEPCAP